VDLGQNPKITDLLAIVVGPNIRRGLSD